MNDRTNNWLSHLVKSVEIKIKDTVIHRTNTCDKCGEKYNVLNPPYDNSSCSLCLWEN